MCEFLHLLLGTGRAALGSSRHRVQPAERRLRGQYLPVFRPLQDRDPLWEGVNQNRVTAVASKEVLETGTHK